MDLRGVFQVFGIIQPLHFTVEETIITSTHRDGNICDGVIYQSCKELVETSSAMEVHLRDKGIHGLHLFIQTPYLVTELISF